jgi:hypothetical protein
MATRSTIALEFADGTVGQVYAHWDGYLSHNGKILLENYSDPFKLQKLIDLGQVSSLGAEIGEPHSFDNPFQYGTKEWENWSQEKKKVCTFYGRDRGETGVGPVYFTDFDHYVKTHQYEEYEYILRTDGNWYVCFNEDGYVRLDEALAQENAYEEKVGYTNY